jgi:hypothetical protein
MELNYRYNYIATFENDYIIVESNYKYGVINDHRIKIIKLIYEYYEIDDVLKKYIKNKKRNLKLNQLL